MQRKQGTTWSSARSALVSAWLLAACAAGCTGVIDSDPESPWTGPNGGRDPHAQAGSNAQDRDGGTGGDGDPNAGSGGNAGGSGAQNVAFECASDPAEVALEGDSLRRLTMTQYANTLRDLIAYAVPSETDAVMAALQRQLDALPVDQREPTSEDLHGSYRRLDQSLQQTHVDAIYAASTAAGAQLTTPARLAVLVGDCATDADAGNDAACLDDFITRFGERALRRPLEAEDLDFYRSVYGNDTTADPAAYADVVAMLLNAPELVYFVEHGETEVADVPDTFELSAHELAARLSYQLWQTLPDDELRALADDGSLLDADVYADQVDRMLEDPRARPALDEFFADWVKVEELAPLDAKNNDPIFQAFAGDDLPGPGLRQAMIDDVLSLLRHYTWDEPAPVPTLLTTNASFAQDEALAQLYGVPVWDGESEPPSFPEDQRPGLFTRALFLSSGSPNTRPIMKGVFLRKHVLCDSIAPPPPGANAMPPELRSDMTTREVVEELTEGPTTVCAGCHATVINPLGFATESFDALGRYRSEQRLFSDDGEEVGTRPIDTSGVPQIFSGDNTAAMDSSELMALIADSGKAEACLARNYFRFTYGRWEDPDVDGCALEAMRSALADGGSVTDLVRAAVMTDAFRRRSFGEQ